MPDELISWLILLALLLVFELLLIEINKKISCYEYYVTYKTRPMSWTDSKALLAPFVIPRIIWLHRLTSRVGVDAQLQGPNSAITRTMPRSHLITLQLYLNVIF